MTRRLARELAGLPPPDRWSDLPPLPVLSSSDRRGKVLQLLAAQPWHAWKGDELAAILGIENVNSFRVQLSQMVPPGLRQQDRASPLRAHARQYLSLCQQALTALVRAPVRKSGSV